jgi:transcription antitermination factor NusG
MVKQMNWYVLYTKARNEKVVANKLTAMGIESYCPTRITNRRWSDRVKKVEEPLFRSYCFVRLPEQDRQTVFSVPGIVRYLYWLKKPAIVRDEEINVIKLMLNEFDHSQLVVTQFQPGDRATIGSGSFSGTEGRVIWQQGKIISIMLESLQVTVTVDLSKNVIS